MNLAFLNDKTPLEAALYYAQELGFPVFPLHHPIESDDGAKCSCGRTQCDNLGKHPRTANGIEDASQDIKTIKDWWKRWPHANVGIRTGVTFLVIDMDIGKEGLTSFPELLAFEPNLRKTLSVQTGGGGKHIFARIPKGAGATHNRVNIWKGIDIRADRGYVVAPPSLHASLQRYRWISEDSEMTELSEAFIEKIRISESGSIPRDSLRNAIIPRGERNISIFRIAASRSSRANETIEDTLSFIRRVNHERCDPPLSDEEIVTIVTSAYTYPPSFLHTDLGNGKAVAHWFGADLRWTNAVGWIEWEEGRWNRITDVHVRTYAHQMTGMLMSIAKSQNNDALTKWAHISQSSGHLSAMIREFQSIAELKSGRINQDTFLLPCVNGTLDLKNNGRFRDSSRDDYMTKRIPINFNANALCPRWEEALNVWMNGDEELIRYIQRVVGYCLTGDTRHQCFFILYGSGANGKSTFIRTLLSLLGEFAITINSKTLMKNSRFSEEPEIVRLLGVRLAVCSESASGGRIDEEAIKRLTGGEPITGRGLYKDPIEFSPTSKIMLHTNHKPRASAYDAALWRRIIPIPFTTIIPKEQQNPLLPWQLQEELEGILAWSVRGTHEERIKGQEVRDIPRAVAVAKREYQEENDVVRAFLEETVIRTGSHLDRISFKELHARYLMWLRLSRRGAALDYKEFNSDLRGRQEVLETKVHNVGTWTNVKFILSPSISSSAIDLTR